MTHGSVDGSEAGNSSTKNQTERNKTMKLNFLKVLNTPKTTADEIAEEIVVLEEKQKDCLQELAGLRVSAKDLRKRKLCGEAISESEVRDADRKVESAQLDLEAINESLVNLNEKLRNTLQAVKDEGNAEIHRRSKLIESDRQKAQEELEKAKARLIVAAEAYVGGRAENLASDGRLYVYDEGTFNFYRAELERLRSQAKHPTYFEKKVEIDEYSGWIIKMDPDDEASNILNRHRAKITERQPVAV